MYALHSQTYHNYLPGSIGSSEVYGKYIVKLLSETSADEYTISQLELCQEKSTDEEKVKVTVFNYLCWPKQSIPQGTTGLLELIECINKKQMSSGNKPVTVMCK